MNNQLIQVLRIRTRQRHVAIFASYIVLRMMWNKKKIDPGRVKQGFTLIELLVAIAVIGVVIILAGVILVSSLRSASKTNTMTLVRQNGNYAISQMAKMIRFAKRLEGVSLNGTTYLPNCVLPTAGALTPTPVPREYKAIKIILSDGGQTIFACQQSIASPPTPANILSNSALLLDTTVVSLNFNSCYFACTQDNVSLAPTVGIYFLLRQSGTSDFFEQKVSIPFQTTVTMRNTNQ